MIRHVIENPEDIPEDLKTGDNGECMQVIACRELDDSIEITLRYIGKQNRDNDDDSDNDE